MRALPHLLPRSVALARIDSVVREHLGHTHSLNLSPALVFNRQVAMYLAHDVFGWTLVPIGRYYGGIHHTTVNHGVRKIRALRKQNVPLADSLDELAQEIRRPLHKPAISPSLADMGVDPNRLCDYDLERLADMVADKLAERMRGKTVKRRSAVA